MTINISYVEEAIDRIEQIQLQLHRRFTTKNEKNVLKIYLNTLSSQGPRYLVS
jgi:hypothetical protein